jgi:hypothetical protein
MLCGYLAYTSVLELLSFHIRTDISTISMWQIRKHTQQIRKHTRTNADLWMNMLRRIRETMWRIHSDVQQYASQYSDDTRGYAGSLESVGAHGHTRGEEVLADRAKRAREAAPPDGQRQVQPTEVSRAAGKRRATAAPGMR